MEQWILVAKNGARAIIHLEHWNGIDIYTYQIYWSDGSGHYVPGLPKLTLRAAQMKAREELYGIYLPFNKMTRSTWRQFQKLKWKHEPVRSKRSHSNQLTS